MEQVLPESVARGLTDAEMEHDRAPYPRPESRLPTLQWPRELPAAEGPARNVAVVERVGAWRRRTDVPMLILWALPGALDEEAFADSMVARVRNIQSTFVGVGRHYVQKDQPEDRPCARRLAEPARAVADRAGRFRLEERRAALDGSLFWCLRR